MTLIVECLLLAAATALQGTLLPLLTLRGARVDAVLAVVVCVGLASGPARGALSGIIAGLMLDSLFTDGLGTYALIYMACGLAGGLLSSQSGWIEANIRITRSVFLVDASDKRRRSFSDHVIKPIAATLAACALKELIVVCIAILVGVAMTGTDVLARVSGTMLATAACALVIAQPLLLLRHPRRRGIF